MAKEIEISGKGISLQQMVKCKKNVTYVNSLCISTTTKRNLITKNLFSVQRRNRKKHSLDEPHIQCRWVCLNDISFSKYFTKIKFSTCICIKWLFKKGLQASKLISVVTCAQEHLTLFFYFKTLPNTKRIAKKKFIGEEAEVKDGQTVPMSKKLLLKRRVASWKTGLMIHHSAHSQSSLLAVRRNKAFKAVPLPSTLNVWESKEEEEKELLEKPK